MENKLTYEQFQAIWRRLKSQLQTPHQWHVNPELEDEAMQDTWEELGRFTFGHVIAAVRDYLESRETKFPTWGQLVGHIRAWMQVDQQYPKQDRTPPAAFITKGALRELIGTPEWQACCDAFQVDLVLAFTDWNAAIKRRGRLRSARDRTTDELRSFLVRSAERIPQMLLPPCGRCGGTGSKDGQPCYCDIGQANLELARRASGT